MEFEFPHSAWRRPECAFDSIKDRVKTPAFGCCIIASYVPLCFYPSENVSCWNKCTLRPSPCRMWKRKSGLLFRSLFMTFQRGVFLRLLVSRLSFPRPCFYPWRELREVYKECQGIHISFLPWCGREGHPGLLNCEIVR